VGAGGSGEASVSLKWRLGGRREAVFWRQTAWTVKHEQPAICDLENAKLEGRKASKICSSPRQEAAKGMLFARMSSAHSV
jgi:hypothetical protein